jgi:hypothetical protein
LVPVAVGAAAAALTTPCAGGLLPTAVRGGAACAQQQQPALCVGATPATVLASQLSSVTPLGGFALAHPHVFASAAAAPQAPPLGATKAAAVALQAAGVPAHAHFNAMLPAATPLALGLPSSASPAAAAPAVAGATSGVAHEARSRLQAMLEGL